MVANAVQEDGITSRHLAFFFPPHVFLVPALRAWLMRLPSKRPPAMVIFSRLPRDNKKRRHAT